MDTEEQMRENMLAELHRQADDERREEEIRTKGNPEEIRRFEKQQSEEQIANHRLFERMTDAKSLEEQRKELYSAVDAGVASLEWANTEYAKLVDVDVKKRTDERAARLNAGIAMARQTATSQLAIEGMMRGGIEFDAPRLGHQMSSPVEVSPEFMEELEAAHEDPPSVFAGYEEPTNRGTQTSPAQERPCDFLPQPLLAACAKIIAEHEQPTQLPEDEFEDRYRALMRESPDLVDYIVDRHEVVRLRQMRRGQAQQASHSKLFMDLGLAIIKGNLSQMNPPEQMAVPDDINSLWTEFQGASCKLSETIPVSDVQGLTSDGLLD